ncbi:S-adenosyl-L-methionine:benzoic acid/salicylic acid carboxyl methyltransferase 3-like [Lotus japonicus]|uniref:S-adenosyl-L-methionine:benzoic acid/salicylic acid carboxyl methyltransferase 3-like n=1 Tax=Lotus japonicus TaxID=34305 RepID=UPI00258C6C0C|nr:S-adenosyl-L-methionine:benzoic acid/salicylic acid carboxyl methyltransferase 3-like [Lotus japonicus]
MEKRETRRKDVAQKLLHMKGGTGETSYAKNSLVQQKAISLTKAMREEAITNLYSKKFPRVLSIADMGCSTGPNTFMVISEVIKSVENICREMKHESPEYQFFMNDLPDNDFNNIFKSLDNFKKKLSDEMEDVEIGPCFFFGVPGSFYGRVFPTKTLHFVHSSYSVHWLSRVPQGIENNKGNICEARTSPLKVRKAYYKQFQKDFSLFLKSRAEELIEGGRMVLILMGRRGEEQYNKDGCYIWELLALALNDMVSQGIINEEQIDTFNVPMYTPSPSEVRLEVLKEGSFTINCVEVSEVHWNVAHDHDDDDWNNNNANFDSKSESLIKCMRAVAEPLLITHFGEVVIEEIFRRYQAILADRMSKEKTEFVNVNISMTKKE